MRLHYHFLYLITLNIFFVANNTFAQTANFDETWKEFLINNKISNMSTLIRPDKVHNQPAYARYLLMNTNTCFCQSDIQKAESLMAEIHTIDETVHKSIKGFVPKMVDLENKINAYHSIDAIWKQFLRTQKVSVSELEAIQAAKSLCEKQTLAKYSYMTAFGHFCNGEVSKSKDIFENRTLRLIEKTTLRVNDVEGLAQEAAKMKSLYQDMDQLETAWRTYMDTGVSPGFDIELPLFPCNPAPNIKALVLEGAVDICNSAPDALVEIQKLQSQSNVKMDRELKQKLKELETATSVNDANLAALNKAWKEFIPDNEVKSLGTYGYEYCSKEPLIRAYIMDGFANVCGLAELMLDNIDELISSNNVPLEQITMIKISELKDLTEQYKTDMLDMEGLWKKFISQGDTLYGDYYLADYYCDNIDQAKSWVIKGLSVSCEQAHPYLEQIDELQRTFEFSFEEDVECRVQKLRIRVWDCRYKALAKLAQLEAEAGHATYEERLAGLMDEYGMGERPEVCLFGN